MLFVGRRWQGHYAAITAADKFCLITFQAEMEPEMTTHSTHHARLHPLTDGAYLSTLLLASC